MAKKNFKAIIGDGIALALPLAVLLYVFIKIIEFIQKTISPIAKKLGMDTFLGDITVTVLALVLLLVFFLACGLFMQFGIVSKMRDSIESIILRFFPSLNILKTLLAERFETENATAFWKPVLLQQSHSFSFALLVEESPTVGVFFILDKNSLQEGKTEILKREQYTYTHVDAAKMRKCVKQYGAGSSELIAGILSKSTGAV